MEPITATIKAGILNGRSLTPKMEIVAGKSLVALTPEGETREIVSVRWYMGRSRTASVVHCTIWTPENSGSGRAGGYGYDKESAAFAEACENAGITLSRDIAGVGESAIREAILAIGRALGYSGGLIVTHS